MTFLYIRCPDGCPLIATNLHATQAAPGGENAVYGISAKGALTTIYPADFKPADLVHDTPLLLGR